MSAGSEGSPSPSPTPRRRLGSYRLATLLVVMLIVGLAIRFLGIPAYRAHQRTLLDEQLKLLGAAVSPGKERILFSGRDVSDSSIEGLAHRLRYYPQLRQVDLFDTSVTDEGFALLARQRHIVTMHVQSDLITDEALEAAMLARPGLDVQRRAPDPVASGLAFTEVYRDAILVAKLSPANDDLYYGTGDGGAHRRTPDGLVDDWQAHGNWLFDLELSPDRRWLATVGGDDRLCIWDSDTLEMLADRVAGEGDVHGVVWLDGMRLATAGDDGAVRLWRLESRVHGLAIEPLAAREHAHQAAIPRIVVDRERRRLLTASRDDQIGIWTWTDEELVETGRLIGHEDDVMAISVSPDGAQALSVGYDGQLFAWDLERQSAVDSWRVTDQRLYAFQVDWVGSQAYVGHHSGLTRVDLNTGEHLEIDDQRLVASVAFVAGAELLTSSADGRMVYRGLDLRPNRSLRYAQLFSDPADTLLADASP